MDDLVKRLRGYGDEPYDVSHGEIAEWMHKAAAAIEGLLAQQLDHENINTKADAIDNWINTSAEQHERIAQLERKLETLVSGLKAMRAEWLEENATSDSCDIVTPFDRYLHGGAQ